MDAVLEWFFGLTAHYTAFLAIIDPFAVIPIYLSLTRSHPMLEQVSTCRKAVLIAAGILLAFALFGSSIFKLFGIGIPAFQIAGGILLLRLGIDQLSADRERVKSEEEDESETREDISIFPLATPLLAGPGSISTVVLHSGQAKSIPSIAALYSALFLVLLTSYALLRSAPMIYKVLGQTGLNLMTRIMGVILCAIAVQFVIDGLLAVARQFLGQ